MKTMMQITSLALIFSTCLIDGATADEPTAASLAFTSSDKVIQQARALLDQGQFKSAESLLRQDLDNLSADQQRVRLELLEIMARIKYEYALTPRNYTPSSRE